MYFLVQFWQKTDATSAWMFDVYIAWSYSCKKQNKRFQLKSNLLIDRDVFKTLPNI